MRSRTWRRGMPSPLASQAGVPCCPAPVTTAAAPAPAPATPGAPPPQGSPAPRPAHRRVRAARLTRYRPSGSGPLLCRRPRARIGRPAQEQGGEGGDTEEAEEGGSRPWTWRLLRPYSKPLLVGERERRETRNKEMREKRGKWADMWAPLPRVSHITKPPSKTTGWPNVNGFDSLMVKDTRFWSCMVKIKLGQ